MTVEEVKEVIAKGEEMGFNISVRDIAYVILYYGFDNSAKMAYTCLHGGNSTERAINQTENQKKMKFLKPYILNLEESKKAKTEAEEKPIEVKKKVAKTPKGA